MEALRWARREEGSGLSGAAEGVDHRRQVEVGETVRVVGEEHLVILDVPLHRDEALPDVGAQAGVDEGDLPVLDVAVLEPHLAAALGHGEVVRDPFLVVEEELLHHVGLVAEAEDELLVPEVRVVLHEVPEDRAVPDLDHRLRDLSRVLAQPGAEASAEQDHLHGSPPGTRNAIEVALRSGWNTLS